MLASAAAFLSIIACAALLYAAFFAAYAALILNVAMLPRNMRANKTVRTNKILLNIGMSENFSFFTYQECRQTRKTSCRFPSLLVINKTSAIVNLPVKIAVPLSRRHKAFRHQTNPRPNVTSAMLIIGSFPSSLGRKFVSMWPFWFFVISFFLFSCVFSSALFFAFSA